MEIRKKKRRRKAAQKVEIVENTPGISGKFYTSKICMWVVNCFIIVVGPA